MRTAAGRRGIKGGLERQRRPRSANSPGTNEHPTPESLFRETITNYLPTVDDGKLDRAALHWRLSLDLNSPVCFDRSMLHHARAALVLRQARISENGALIDRSVVPIVHDRSGDIVVHRRDEFRSDDFTSPNGLRRLIPEESGDKSAPSLVLSFDDWTTPGLSFEWDDPLPESAARWNRRLEPRCGDLDVWVLPVPELWRKQVHEWANEVSIRIVNETLKALASVTVHTNMGTMKTQLFHMALRTNAYGHLRGRMMNGIEWFSRQLDPSILDAVLDGTGGTSAHYNFLFAKGRKDGQLQRRQAVIVYPLLHDAFIASGELTQGIDEGVPLKPVLRDHFCCDNSALRTVKERKRLGDHDGFDISDVLTALSHCPPEWHPRTPEQWDAFNRLTSIPNRVPANTWGLDRMKELGPDWQKSLDEIGDFIRLDDIADYRVSLRSHLLEAPFEHAIGTWMPEIAFPETVALFETIMATIQDDRKLMDQLDASDRWHRTQDALLDLADAQKSGTRRKLSWLPLTETFKARNGVHIMPLTTSRDLFKEGRLMNHCVAGYDHGCAFSNVHIVRLSSASYGLDPTSTAELHVHGNNQVSVFQHRAHSNADPSRDDVAALEQYVREINAGKIRVEWKKLLEDLIRRRHRWKDGYGSGFTSNNGLWFDWRERGTLERVFEFYRPLLPRPYRRMDVPTFHREMGLAVAIEHERTDMEGRLEASRNRVLTEEEIDALLGFDQEGDPDEPKTDPTPWYRFWERGK